MRAGGRPLLVPPAASHDPDDLLGIADGLLLVGGGDIEPRRYDAAAQETLYGLEQDRDELELGLVLAADRLGVPTLAICRGVQLVNVAFGGTLHQHLPDIPGLIPHGTPGGGEPVLHDVRVAPGSRLRRSTRAETLVCSSHHHQGIDRIAPGLVATAWSDDGLVEGLEHRRGWIVAVQWHPEDTASTDTSQQSLFDELARQAIGRRSGP